MSAWGAPTAWANQAEEEAKDEAPKSFAAERQFPGLGQAIGKKASAAADDDAMFPTLGAAAKAPKKANKKGQKMSLADLDAFASASGGGGGGGGGGGSYRPPVAGAYAQRDLDNIVLPTGPAQRDDDDDMMQGGPGMRYGDEKLGGAFKDYGGDRGGGDRYGDRDRDRYGDRGRDDRRGDRYGDRDDRRGGFDRDDPRDDRDRSPEGPSRADADSNWGRSKREMSPPRRGDRGYDDRDRDMRGGDRRDGRYPSRSPSPERDWGNLRNRAGPPPRDDRDGRGRSRSPSPERDWSNIRNRPGPPPSLRDDARGYEDRGMRPGQRADEAGDRWGKRAEGPPPMDGYDRDRDGGRDGPGRDDGSRRPRLQLKARSADADKTAAAIAGGGSSLFGGARPRELALQEAGRDYRKEDLVRSAGAVKRRETNDEKRMKKEITELKENLEALPKGGEEYDVIHGELSEKETALAKLTLELDDKVRFAQRNAPEGGDRGGAKRGDEKGGEGDGAEGDGAADGAPGEKKDSRSRDRDLDRGWGEGKAERQRGGGGKSGGGDKKPGGSGGGRESTQREPRAPRAMMKAAEPEAVKVVSGGFAALGVDDDA